MYYYRAHVGTAQITWFGGDDRQARRKVARWCALFWEAHRAKSPGTIGHSINNTDPDVRIGRVWCENEIIPARPYTMIDAFKASELPEFVRVNR